MPCVLNLYKKYFLVFLVYVVYLELLYESSTGELREVYSKHVELRDNGFTKPSYIGQCNDKIIIT